MSVFPNARSKLLGEDTHAAALSGSVIAELTINQTFPPPLVTGQCTGSAPTFVTVGSTSVTITEAINKLEIFGQAFFRNSSQNRQFRRLIRDNDEGDILGSGDTGVSTAGTWNLNAIIINETVGVHTYQWQIENGDGNTETCCIQNATFRNILSEADDDHASTLSGDNTQTSQELEIIT